jgi:hypothetical protein
MATFQCWRGFDAHLERVYWAAELSSFDALQCWRGFQKVDKIIFHLGVAWSELLP